jgi:hypothetical protein
VRADLFLELITNDGALVEPRGCNRWQSVANRIGAEAAKTSENRCRGCHGLPEAFHGKGGGRRFESVRGLCKSRANRGFFCRRNLHGRQFAVGMEPFMELPEVEAGTLSFETAPIANGTASGSPRFRAGTGRGRSQLIAHGPLGLRAGLGHEPACEQVECGRELPRHLGICGPTGHQPRLGSRIRLARWRSSRRRRPISSTARSAYSRHDGAPTASCGWSAASRVWVDQ